MKTITAPTIHLNGTAAENIIEALSGAIRRLRAAMEALDETQPNARDYYLQGPAAFPAAVGEYQSRARKIRDVYDDLGAIREAVQEQVDVRMRKNARRSARRR